MEGGREKGEGGLLPPSLPPFLHPLPPSLYWLKILIINFD